MIRIADLIEKAAEYMPPHSDLEQISKAYIYSATLHRDHFQDNGAPALQHALEVSGILAGMRLDLRCIVAGLLHDVIAEQLTEPEALREAVGEEPAVLVEELSRLTRAAFHGTEAARAEHMRQMILASTRDLRVILILLADRLHLMRDIAQVPVEERAPMARETLAIYAPIAHRLGIQFFKDELEDLAFSILEPAAWKDLQEQVEVRVTERSSLVKRINREVTELLKTHGVQGEVLGRTKHLYSIHRKMQRTKVELDQIYDLLALRILLDTPEECYRVLGLVHAAYTPMPGRFKDYIALPKENGYQSLHTLVFGDSGNIFEFQIRTREMHNQSEMGVAAHFIYKDGSAPDELELASVNWFRTLLDNLETGQDSHESLELLERDLTPDQLFVFTPTGEVIKLPPGATPIDFAYAVHSEVGHRCTGAKMDGKMLSIRSPLKNGSVVRILTSSRQEPKEDWLKAAVSSRALGHIRSYLRKKEKREAIEIGRELVTREAKALVKKPDELFKLEPVREWMQRQGMSNPDDVHAAVGFGRVTIRDVLERLFPGEKALSGKSQPAAPQKPLPSSSAAGKAAKTKSRNVISVAGLENMMTRFAKCCTPVHGDPIIGIITRGRGVSVHHRNCPNLARHAIHEERMVEVDWVDETQKSQPVTLAIQARDSIQDLLEPIRLLVEEEGTPITSGRITSSRGAYTQHLTLQVGDSRQLKRILQRLNAIKGIRAERVLESA